MKKIVPMLLALLLVVVLLVYAQGSGDSGAETEDGSESGDSSELDGGSQTETPEPDDSGDDGEDDSEEDDTGEENDDTELIWDTTNVTYITLNGSKISVNGSGASVSGSVVTIRSAGTYSFSGTLDDGQIIVNTDDEDMVVLILNGADITCLSSSPIYIVSAEDTVISLADGTDNYVTDGDSYVLDDPTSDEPNAAIFSKDDLIITGSGSLTVNANYKNGIQGKDDLEITDAADITVNAENDGIKGKDSLVITDSVITIDAGADGMQATNEDDTEKGYVCIEDSAIYIECGEDGIQAVTDLTVDGGEIEIYSNGGKGLKAGTSITVTGGDIVIETSDDAVHSNGSVTIDGGDLTLTSDDDGVHAETTLEINGGTIDILECYEGLEAIDIIINDGDPHRRKRDDGINGAGGTVSDMMNGGRGGGQMSEEGNCSLTINGGYVYVDAAGDGLDVNGPITMTGGVVIVNGPTNSANGALDYTGSCTVDGGYLLAVGSYGMAQSLSTSSDQYSISLTFTSSLPAGTLIHIESQDGEDILTFVSAKTYQSLVLCSPDLVEGETYDVYYGGSSTGTEKDGLYTGGTYTDGTNIGSFTA